MTNKIDFKKTLDAYSAQRAQFRIIDVPDMQYLMIYSRGDLSVAPANQRTILGQPVMPMSASGG